MILSKLLSTFLFSIILFPFYCSASTPLIAISEIMYNPKGNDTGQEWIEFSNTSPQKINLSKWKIEINNKKHRLNPPPKNGGRGSIIIQPNQYFIIASDAQKFLISHPNYSGTVIDSSFSLTNKSGEIKIINDQNQIIDQLNYSSVWGGNDNSKTLARINLNLGNDQQNWTSSQQDGGTPGQKNNLMATNNKNISKTQSTNQSTSSSNHQSSRHYHQSALLPASTIISIPAPKTVFPIKAKTKENLIYALTNQIVQFDGTDSTMPTGTKIIWNFGDGQTNSKIKTKHQYSFPGKYLPTLNLSFGNETSQAKMKIIIYPRNIFINEFYPNPRGRDVTKEWIEITNQNNFPVDLSGYRITNNSKSAFVLPIGSLIAPQSYLVIQPKISLKNSSSSLSFFYPNNLLLQRIIYPSAQEGWSIARNNYGKFYFTAQPTPGTTNLITNSAPTVKVNSSTLPVKKFNPKIKSKIKATENYAKNKKISSLKTASQNLNKKNIEQNNTNTWPIPKLQSNNQKLLPIVADINQPSNKIPIKLIALLFSLSLIISGTIWLIKK